jgi:hypothetical protein
MCPCRRAAVRARPSGGLQRTTGRKSPTELSGIISGGTRSPGAWRDLADKLLPRGRPPPNGGAHGEGERTPHGEARTVERSRRRCQVDLQERRTSRDDPAQPSRSGGARSCRDDQVGALGADFAVGGSQKLAGHYDQLPVLDDAQYLPILLVRERPGLSARSGPASGHVVVGQCDKGAALQDEVLGHHWVTTASRLPRCAAERHRSCGDEASCGRGQVAKSADQVWASRYRDRRIVVAYRRRLRQPERSPQCLPHHVVERVAHRITDGLGARAQHFRPWS